MVVIWDGKTLPGKSGLGDRFFGALERSLTGVS